MLISPCSSRCLIVRALPGSLPLALSFLSCCNALGSSEGLRTVRFPSRSWTGIIQELGELKEMRRGGERCRNGAGAMDFQSYANLPVSRALSWRLGAILFPFDFSFPPLFSFVLGLGCWDRCQLPAKGYRPAARRAHQRRVRSCHASKAR